MTGAGCCKVVNGTKEYGNSDITGSQHFPPVGSIKSNKAKDIVTYNNHADFGSITLEEGTNVLEIPIQGTHYPAT